VADWPNPSEAFNNLLSKVFGLEDRRFGAGNPAARIEINEIMDAAPPAPTARTLTGKEIAALLADGPFAVAATRGAALVVGAGEPLAAVYATPSALGVFGVRDLVELDASLFRADSPGARRLRDLARTLSPGGAPRLESLRFYRGRLPIPVEWLCARVAGRGAVLFVAAAPTRAAESSGNALPIEFVAEDSAAAGSDSAPRALTPAPIDGPARFLWNSDGEGRLGGPDPALVARIGSNAPREDETPSALRARIGFDPADEWAQAIAGRRTFSGLRLAWPEADGLCARVAALSGAPVFDRERGFAGFRGFGIFTGECIAVSAREEPEAAIGAPMATDVEMSAGSRFAAASASLDPVAALAETGPEPPAPSDEGAVVDGRGLVAAPTEPAPETRTPSSEFAASAADSEPTDPTPAKVANLANIALGAATALWNRFARATHSDGGERALSLLEPDLISVVAALAPTRADVEAGLRPAEENRGESPEDAPNGASTFAEAAAPEIPPPADIPDAAVEATAAPSPATASLASDGAGSESEPRLEESSDKTADAPTSEMRDEPLGAGPLVRDVEAGARADTGESGHSPSPEVRADAADIAPNLPEAGSESDGPIAPSLESEVPSDAPSGDAEKITTGLPRATDFAWTVSFLDPPPATSATEAPAPDASEPTAGPPANPAKPGREGGAEIYVLRPAGPPLAAPPNVVPFRPGAVGMLPPFPDEPESLGRRGDSVELSSHERDAFREIARTLGVRSRGPRSEPDGAEPPSSAPIEDAPAAPASEAADRAVASLIDQLPIGALVTRSGEAIYLNRTLLELVGYSSIESFRSAGGLDHIFRGRDPTALVGEGGDIPLVAADGELLNVDAHARSISWNGEPAVLISLRRSRGMEHQAEVRAVEREARALASNARDLAAALDLASDGMVRLDGAGRILALNRRAEALLGYDEKEAAGESFLILFAPPSQPEATAALERLAREPIETESLELIARERGGRAIPARVDFGRFAGAGAPEYFALLRDLTKAKATEREREAAREAAETASARKTEFLARVSHEIRTPLHAILGFAEVMIEERFGPIGGERYKDYVKDIHASGRHVMSLANDLLDLSKIEAGKMEMQFAPVDANRIIRECVALMQPQAARERIIMRLSLFDKLPNVMADERSLRQIMLNLMSNAVKFNEPGGQVIISTALDETGHSVIRVRDTGLGMNESELGVALEPFRRVAGGGREGTGLGLPLTKALAEANHADFTIKSRKEHGTLVEVAFPVARAAQ
jgi:PAS domain S-box-containing protein